MLRIILIIIAVIISGCNKSIITCFEEASQITYKNENAVDYWQSPYETMLLGTGDCEDISLVLLDKLYNNGYKAHLVVGIYNVFTSIKINDGKSPVVEDRIKPQFLEPPVEPIKVTIVLHAWVEMTIGDEDYILDPTNGQIIKKSHKPKHEFMKLPKCEYIEKSLREYKRRNGIVVVLSKQYAI